MAEKTDLVRTSEVIEGDYSVIQPPPPVRWSFWGDDFPNLVRLIAGPPIAGLIAYAVHRMMR